MQILNSEIERSAFALFSCEHSDEYRRILCYVTAKAVSKTRQVDSVVLELIKKYQYRATDIRNALAVLKSPFAFDSLSIWSKTPNAKQLCCYKGSDLSEAWFKEIETMYPHVKLVTSTN